MKFSLKTIKSIRIVATCQPVLIRVWSHVLALKEVWISMKNDLGSSIGKGICSSTMDMRKVTQLILSVCWRAIPFAYTTLGRDSEYSN